jgi:hypothetical protein
MIISYNKFINNINENYSQNALNNVLNEMKQHKIGDIVSIDTMFKYIEALHDFEFDNDFMVDEIYEFNKLELKKLELKNIDLDSVSETLVKEYEEEYKITNWYPPIIYNEDKEMIIDGYHRANALENLGEKYILAWCGV